MSESPELRPDPPGWLLRYLSPLHGWEAVHRDHERGDNAVGVAQGPVWFSGKSRGDVLDLIYAYELEHLESLRRGWIDEAREALEMVETWLSLRGDGDPVPESFEALLKIVRRTLERVPPTEAV